MRTPFRDLRAAVSALLVIIGKEFVIIGKELVNIGKELVIIGKEREGTFFPYNN